MVEIVIINHMKVLVKNKDAYRNFEILERFTGGIELNGGEVKSLRKSQGNLQGSFLLIQKNKKQHAEIFIKNMYIPPYQEKNTGGGYDTERVRKILINRKEINRIDRSMNNKGTTLIPISIISAGTFIKIEFATARGKKKFDKRQDLKERAQKRDAERDSKIRFN